MALRRRDWDDEEDEEWQRAFGPSGDTDTIACPYCKEPIPEDTPRCPYCENYVSQEDAPPKRKPWWIIITVGVCLLIIVMWVMNGW
jgi:predicted nucleic acid-binding Zn ribbon protein